MFDAWFAGKAKVVSLEGEALTLSVPSRFLASHIRQTFEREVLESWRPDCPGLVRLEVIVAAETTVPELAAKRDGISTDAQWLIEEGIALVAEHMRVSAHVADRTITEWLKRCGRDVAGLRAILTETAAHRRYGDEFAGIVKQRTRSMLQQPLRFGPEATVKKRSA